MLRRLNNSSGDTIVEVLIALGIISVVLVGAFAVTSRSNKTIQGSQEAGQATKLAQSQVEFLRAGTFNTVTDKCFKVNGQATALASDCVVDAAGNPTNAVPFYTLSITKQPASQYAVSVTWDSATGTGPANVTLYYRQ